MAIDTFANLKTELAAWLHRSDLTSKIPDFITLIEAKMSEDLDAKSMETRTTISTVASNAYVALPSDFKVMQRLVLSSDPAPPLIYASPEQLSRDYQDDEERKPVIYTIVGAQLQLAPIPDAIYSLELAYERRIPALSDANTTNWLLARSPNAYLFGALWMAQLYAVNDARMLMFQSLYADAINGINLTDWHSGANMRVRAG